MQATDAFVLARQGRALAFVGSGFSLGATAVSGLPIPTTSELAKRLMSAIGQEEEADFDLAADLFRKSFPHDPTALGTFVHRQFKVAETSPTQESLASYPWQRIYTTNYDNIIEVGSVSRGITRTAVSASKSPSDLSRTDPWIVHLHGYVGELEGQAAATDFLLGRKSYIETALLRTKWPTQLQTDLAKASAIFVVGFSFADLHIARLFGEVLSIKRKTFVVVRPNAPAALKAYAAEFGTVLEIGVEGLVKEIDAIDASSLPTRSAPALLSFTERTLPEMPRAPTPEDIFKLLVSGVFDPAIHLQTLLDKTKPYGFSRNYALRELANWKGTARKFLISSRIGNGKSIFMRQLAVQLSKDGFIVCDGHHPNETLHAEIEYLRSRNQPLAFLYEGIREFETSIKAVADTLDARDILIVATRPTAFATDYQNLNNVLGEGFSRLDLDTLTPADISDLEALLSFYGLWGNRAGHTPAAHAKFVREDCGSEPRAVLLHLFRTSSISGRIREPVQRLIAAGGVMPTVLASLLAVRLADCPIGFADVCDLLDVDPKAVHEAFREAGVNDLFPDSDVDFQARSSILSEHLLSELMPAAISLSAVRLLVERLVDFRDADWRFEESIPRILRFAIVTRIFRGGASRPFIISLYEAILEIAYLRDDPQFWLQLAMARLEAKEWLQAEKALETSYEKARSRPGYRTYMLDNQMTRFLLTSATAGHGDDIDANALRACELMTPRLANRGNNLDIYGYRLIEPLLQFHDALAAKLGTSARSAVLGTIASAKSAIAATRNTRTLDDEEERIWKMLRGR